MLYFHQHNFLTCGQRRKLASFGGSTLGFTNGSLFSQAAVFAFRDKPSLLPVGAEDAVVDYSFPKPLQQTFLRFTIL
jgi:hypothetical protein